MNNGLRKSNASMSKKESHPDVNLKIINRKVSPIFTPALRTLSVILSTNKKQYGGERESLNFLPDKGIVV
jgi:hypothetical protein